MTIANMTTEWGAVAAVFPVDQITLNYLHSRGVVVGGEGGGGGVLAADERARYAKVVVVDLSTVGVVVAGPHQVGKVVPVQEVEEKRVVVHKAYLASCVNSRVGDIKAAAEVLLPLLLLLLLLLLLQLLLRLPPPLLPLSSPASMCIPIVQSFIYLSFFYCFFGGWWVP